MTPPPKQALCHPVSVPSLTWELRETESLFCLLQGGKGRIGVVISSYMHFTNVSARYEGRRRLGDGAGGTPSVQGKRPPLRARLLRGLCMCVWLTPMLP